jgi:hypothetical protein
MKRTSQQFENDFFPGWGVNKKHASAATLKWQKKFIAAKKKVIRTARPTLAVPCVKNKSG